MSESKVVIISAERGLNTIASLLDPARVFEVGGMTELRLHFPKIADLCVDSSWWLCVDGGSQICEWIANDQLSGADRFFDATVLGKKITDDLKPFGRYMSEKSMAIDTQRIYGRIGREIENLMAGLVRMPCNIYINFLEDYTGVDSKRNKCEPWGPDVPGRVGLKAVMSSFDFVGRTDYTADGRLQAGFDARSLIYLARTREDQSSGPPIPATIPGFNLSDFVTLIRPTVKDRPLSVCLYGRYGTRKTLQIGELIRGGA